MVAKHCCYGKWKGFILSPFQNLSPILKNAKGGSNYVVDPIRILMLKKLASILISAQSISSVVLDLQPCIQIQYQQFKLVHLLLSRKRVLLHAIV